MPRRSIRILLALSILIVPSDTRVAASPVEVLVEAQLAAVTPAGATLTLDHPSSANREHETICPRLASDGDDLDGEPWTVPVLAPLAIRLAIHFTPTPGTARIEPSPATRSIVRLLC